MPDYFMDRTERFHLIDQMLCNQRVVTRAQFLDALEVSPATFKRDLEYLRDRLMAPIVWDRERRGYCYEKSPDGEQFQLPGLWFNTSEIQALLSMDALLANLQPGMLSNHIEPLRSRIRIPSLNFMRGRTFLNKYIILDEAQNLTPKQMKTLITRAGPGTKIVCLGNVAQIDTPYLTETTSGLTYVVDRFKDWPHGGHVTLLRGERSRLADFASDSL